MLNSAEVDGEKMLMSTLVRTVRWMPRTASGHYERLEELRREQREELEARLRELRVSLTSPDTVDLNDVGVPCDSVSSAGVWAAVVEITSQTLQGIEGALERLQCGQYGVCAECGAEISAARLRAIPFAERCRDCQDLADAHGIVPAA